MKDASIPVNFLSDPHSSKHKGCPYMICCGDGPFEVYIKLSSFSLHSFFRSWGKVSYQTTLNPSKDLGSDVLLLRSTRSRG